jgi:hypothetical protein
MVAGPICHPGRGVGAKAPDSDAIGATTPNPASRAQVMTVHRARMLVRRQDQRTRVPGFVKSKYHEDECKLRRWKVSTAVARSA